MRYFIGNIIRGEAAEYYKATCAELASHYGIEDVSAIVPPHITVKSGFDRNSIDAVDDAISLITEAPAIPLSISRWNHFTTRTIFLEAESTPKELKDYVTSVLMKTKELGLPFVPQEDDFRVRMSIARFLKPFQYDEIWKYLSSIPAPEFDIAFDNLTIFTKEKREDKAWKVLKTFPLTGKR